MYKLVAVIGKSASGKDTIVDILSKKNKNLHKKVSTSTRPARQGEVDGVDYHFVSVEDFTHKLLNYELIEANEFNDWFYGTDIKDLSKEKVNIGVFNPEGVRQLSESKEIDLLTIFVTSRDKDRIIRSLNREDNPDIDEIMRRYKTDRYDFYDLDFDYEIVPNTEQLISAVEKAEKLIEKKFGEI